MHNQHAGLSQTLAEERITERTSEPPTRGCCLVLADCGADAGHG